MGPLGVLIWLLSVSPASAATLDDLPSNAVYQVTRIRVEGAGHVGKRAILDTMLSTPPPWYKPWKRWSERSTFNPELFRTDLDRVNTLLRESGYYEARVTHELEPKGASLEITLHIDEGPPAIATQVALAASDFALSEKEESALRAQMSLKPGDVFTQKDYDASRDRIERSYLEHGFAYVDVQKAAEVDTATHEVRVTYTITRRTAAVFGQTTIDGLAKLPDVLVQREIAYEPGKPYDPRQIEKTQANIFGLNLFRSVTTAPSNLDQRTGTVDVAIHVAEGPPHSIKLGIGYGLEDEIRAQAQWQHNNFLGGGRQLGFRIKASFITQAFEGEFRQPYFLHPKQTFVLPLTQSREDEPGFTVIQTRLAPRIERKIRPELTVSLGYNIEHDDLSKVPAETQQRLDQFKARGVVSSFTATLERNTAGDLLDPHDGSVTSVALEQAGGPWHGDYTFYRGLFEAKTYIPAWLRNQVVAARFRIGAGDGFGQSKDLPMFRRFFAGGINSTRGYDRYKLGPLTSHGDPIGGRSLIEGGLELRTPVYHSLGAVVFLDAAQVDERPFHYDLGKLQYGTGPGIRYATPVGPLRLDIGFPLNAPAGLPSWQVHFSIGQAF
jgi:outer membrane protein assembly complex protein YaeT